MAKRVWSIRRCLYHCLNSFQNLMTHLHLVVLKKTTNRRPLGSSIALPVLYVSSNSDISNVSLSGRSILNIRRHVFLFIKI